MSGTYDFSGDSPSVGIPQGDHAVVSVLRTVLVPLSIVLWAVGISGTDSNHLGAYGLTAALPYTFYLSLAVLIVSFGIEIARAELSRFRLGLHVVVFVWILYGTAGVVYSEGRYAWLYKTVGVIQYVAQNGSLDRSIDIYHHWPGFFALAAWFDKVAGVGTPVDYARWAQVVFELAAIPLLYAIYQSFGLSERHRWLGLMLYYAGNWIGQDYLSPQALGTLLSLGIMALAARWLFAGNFSGSGESRTPQFRAIWPVAAALLLLYLVLTFTHEISPYLITTQLIALAIAGILRPRWVALATAVIAIAYLVPNFAFVNSHYGVISSIGNFFGNVKPPSAAAALPYSQSQRIIGYSSDLLSIGIWVLALIGAWLRRKSLRTVIALLFLTFSPFAVLAGGAYGNEGVLRVYLFSLPWAAALGASALAPLRSLSGRRESAATGRPVPHARLLGSFDRGTLRAPLVIAVAVILFFVEFYGDDASNAVSSSEANTVLSFLGKSTPGPVFVPDPNGPLFDTAKYYQFGEVPFLDATPISPDIDAVLARTAAHLAPRKPAYVVVTPSMIAYSQAYGATRQSNFSVLHSSLDNSPYWKVIANDGNGTIIYGLTPAGIQIPTSGQYFSKAFLAVP